MKVSNSKIIINSDETEIIRLIKSPNNLEKFHPFCKKNKVEVWNKEKSIDFVEYHNNKIYKRKTTILTKINTTISGHKTTK